MCLLNRVRGSARENSRIFLRLPLYHFVSVDLDLDIRGCKIDLQDRSRTYLMGFHQK